MGVKVGLFADPNDPRTTEAVVGASALSRCLVCRNPRFWRDDSRPETIFDAVWVPLWAQNAGRIRAAYAAIGVPVHPDESEPESERQEQPEQLAPQVSQDAPKPRPRRSRKKTRLEG